MTLRLEGVRLPMAELDLCLDLSLEGPVSVIVGPSGSGKTTTLEIVAGLRTPRTGRVQLGANVLVDVERGVNVPPRARGIGYLTQDDTLFPHLSVERNLLYGAAAAPGASVDADRLSRVCAALGLDALRKRSPRELSGGERRRVALGRALLRAPRLLLLDEPLTALNAELRDAVIELLARIKGELGTPMLYVTHSPGEVDGLADEVVELRAGLVTSRARPAQCPGPGGGPAGV